MGEHMQHLLGFLGRCWVLLGLCYGALLVNYLVSDVVMLPRS